MWLYICIYTFFQYKLTSPSHKIFALITCMCRCLCVNLYTWVQMPMRPKALNFLELELQAFGVELWLTQHRQREANQWPQHYILKGQERGLSGWEPEFSSWHPCKSSQIPTALVTRNLNPLLASTCIRHMVHPRPYRQTLRHRK